ncbi:MAG: transglutaminase domain-containing protein [Nitrospirota bacterium]
MMVKILYSVSINQRGRITSVWLPLPVDTDYQKLISLNREGNFSESGVFREDIYDTPMLYIEWRGGKTKKIEVKIDVEIGERNTEWSKVNEDGNIPEDIKIFLMPTLHIPTDKIVKEYADRITMEKKSVVEKVKAIYDWVIENTYREPRVKACGLGNVESILKSGKFCGKCVDINSLFVALVRASKIPTREVFGIRVDKFNIAQSLGKKGDITTAQHCKAEFYVTGYGWVPVDPADVRKVILEEDLSLKNAKVKKIKEYLFGNWEDNWLAFNHARDFTLNPPQNKTPLNYFMYPYCEVDGDSLDYFEPETFRYKIFSSVSS